MKKYIPLLVVIAILLVVVFFPKLSPFGNIDGILNNNYTNNGCTHENRVEPSGRVPASWVGLSDAERNNLLKNFITNNKFT